MDPQQTEPIFDENLIHGMYFAAIYTAGMLWGRKGGVKRWLRLLSEVVFIFLAGFLMGEAQGKNTYFNSASGFFAVFFIGKLVGYLGRREPA